MSEGPEVRIMADKIHDALSGERTIQNMLHKSINEETKNKIIKGKFQNRFEIQKRNQNHQILHAVIHC